MPLKYVMARQTGQTLIRLLYKQLLRLKKQSDLGLNCLPSPVCPKILDHYSKSLNQRTSGPVNAHLTPGPGIYFNAFIPVYSCRAGADNPLGTNVDVNRKPLSLCPSVASFKTISLKYDFKHILNDFIHVYSPGTRAKKNPWGQRTCCNLAGFVPTMDLDETSVEVS